MTRDGLTHAWRQGENSHGSPMPAGCWVRARRSLSSPQAGREGRGEPGSHFCIGDSGRLGQTSQGSPGPRLWALAAGTSPPGAEAWSWGWHSPRPQDTGLTADGSPTSESEGLAELSHEARTRTCGDVTSVLSCHTSRGWKVMASSVCGRDCGQKLKGLRGPGDALRL